jgi:hypothetical protein
VISLGDSWSMAWMDSWTRSARLPYMEARGSSGWGLSGVEGGGMEVEGGGMVRGWSISWEFWESWECCIIIDRKPLGTSI